MKHILCIVMLVFLTAFAESLFQVKDSTGSPVLDVSDNGMTILNASDTLMTITSEQIKAFVDQNASKGLSRSFSVTSTSSRKASNRVFSISNDAATMWEGTGGERYTDFSPENIFMGLNSGMSSSGAGNVFIGNNSGKNTTWGSRNIFLGNQAGENAMCDASVLIGQYAGMNMGVTDIAEFNIAIGQSAGSSSAGSSNIFIGPYAGKTAKGSSNTYIGSEAGKETTDGFGNVFLGASAGLSNLTGYSNVFVGNYSGASNLAGAKNVFLGNSAGANETGSDKLYIDNSNTSTPLIYGDFGTNNLVFNTSKVYVKHASGMSNGLYIQNSGYSNYWHFYQYSTGGLHLYYNGIQRGSWNSTTGAYTSYSKEAKYSVEDLDRVTNKIMKLQPKKFNFTNQKSGEMKHIGLIAQEVKEIFPSLVVYNEETDTHGMDYSGFGVLAIKAIQEQQEIIGELKNENAELKARIERIEKLLLKE